MGFLQPNKERKDNLLRKGKTSNFVTYLLKSLIVIFNVALGDLLFSHPSFLHFFSFYPVITADRKLSKKSP